VTCLTLMSGGRRSRRVERRVGRPERVSHYGRAMIDLRAAVGGEQRSAKNAQPQDDAMGHTSSRRAPPKMISH
jgi:hypothetical protein